MSILVAPYLPNFACQVLKFEWYKFDGGLLMPHFFCLICIAMIISEVGHISCGLVGHLNIFFVGGPTQILLLVFNFLKI